MYLKNTLSHSCYVKFTIDEAHMRIITYAFLLIGFGAGNAATAAEYFGEFRDALSGEFIDATPRPKFRLAAEFRFVDPNGLLWSVPSRKEFDGASIPQAFWSFIGGPFDGDYIKASVIHDHYCDEKTRTDHDTHRNFYYGMRAAGVVEWKAKFMYWAVATFGPNWTLTKRVSQNLKCDTAGGSITCSQVPQIALAITSQPGVDLNDPDTLAAALSKASTVARSLKTSSGKILDITSVGQVEASLDGISSSAGKYREVFVAKNFLKNPAQLGVLAQWNASGLDQISAWDGNKLPSYKDSVILMSTSASKIDAGKSFKLDAKSIVQLQQQLDFKSLEMRAAHVR